MECRAQTDKVVRVVIHKPGLLKLLKLLKLFKLPIAYHILMAPGQGSPRGMRPLSSHVWVPTCRPLDAPKP